VHCATTDEEVSIGLDQTDITADTLEDDPPLERKPVGFSSDSNGRRSIFIEIEGLDQLG
jgi:hypothetical protein